MVGYFFNLNCKGIILPVHFYGYAKKTTVNISEYRLKSVTVSQTSSGKYYASILFEYEYQVQEKGLQKFLG